MGKNGDGSRISDRNPHLRKQAEKEVVGEVSDWCCQAGTRERTHTRKPPGETETRIRKAQSDDWVSTAIPISEQRNIGQSPRYGTERLSSQPGIHWKLFVMVMASGIATRAFLPSREPRGRCGPAVTSFHLLL